MKRPWVSNAARSLRASLALMSSSAVAARGERIDQPVVDALALGVIFGAIGGGDVEIAVDQAGQMGRHQPPRVLRVGVVLVDARERFLERLEALRQQVDLGLRGGGEGAAGAEDIAVEALDHLAIGQVGRDVGRGDLARAGEHQHRGDGDGEADRGEEAEHADRDDQADARSPPAQISADRDRDALQRPAEPGVEARALALRRAR